MKLTGRTVLITGGASGLGLGLAKAFLERGNTVIAVGRSERKLADAKAQHPSLVTHACDLMSPEGIAALAAHLAAKHPTLDVLVNNAGVMVNWNALTDPSVEAMEKEVATNLLAPVRLTAALLPLLRAQPKAAIVMVTSGSAFLPTADAPMYGATKAAMHQFTDALRFQLADTSIEVIELVPPTVATEMSAGRFKGASRLAQPIPLDQFVREAMRGLEKGSPTVHVGMTKVMYHLARLFPELVRRQSLATPSAKQLDG